ncbi:MAG TPA: twin-arginine translocase TatA/TatE family subunit [Actinomycetota bacterium]|nr:twin-arginine translocase TatA/TatE family subunit [Actinomycetota bacterium]
MELLVILVLALIVVGPAKLPEVGRTIGRALREFRKAQDEVRQTLTFDFEDREPPRRPVRSSARPGPHPPAPSEEVADDHRVEDRLRAARDEGPAAGGPEGSPGPAGEEPDADGDEPGRGSAREAGAAGDAAAPARSAGTPDEPPAATPRG